MHEPYTVSLRPDKTSTRGCSRARRPVLQAVLCGAGAWEAGRLTTTALGRAGGRGGTASPEPGAERRRQFFREVKSLTVCVKCHAARYSAPCPKSMHKTESQTRLVCLVLDKAGAARDGVRVTGQGDSDGDTDRDWSGGTEVIDRSQRPSGLEAHRGVASPGTGCRARSVSRKADGKWTGTGQRTAARPMSPLHKLEKERVRRRARAAAASITGAGHGQCPQPNTR